MGHCVRESRERPQETQKLGGRRRSDRSTERETGEIEKSGEGGGENDMVVKRDKGGRETEERQEVESVYSTTNFKLG